MASYFQRPLGPDTTLNFLTAQTARGLRRAMLRNNVRLKAFVNYMPPQWVEAESRWYVWYFVDDGLEQSGEGER